MLLFGFYKSLATFYNALWFYWIPFIALIVSYYWVDAIQDI